MTKTPSYPIDPATQLAQSDYLQPVVGAFPDLDDAQPQTSKRFVPGPVFTAYQATAKKSAGNVLTFTDDAMAEYWIVALPDPNTAGYVDVAWRGSSFETLRVFAGRSIKFPRLMGNSIQVTNNSATNDLLVQVFALRDRPFGVGTDNG